MGFFIGITPVSTEVIEDDIAALIDDTSTITWNYIDGSSSLAGSVASPLKLGDGAAATPTFSFANDPDTGIYSAGANILGIAVGGLQVAQWDNYVPTFYGHTAGAAHLQLSADANLWYFTTTLAEGICPTNNSSSRTRINITNTSSGARGDWGMYVMGNGNADASWGSFSFRNESGSGDFPFSINFRDCVRVGTSSALGQNATTLTVQPFADANITGTTTATAATAITVTLGKALKDLAVGDQVSLSSDAADFAFVLAVNSDTSIEVDHALGDGTSQTLKRRRAIQRWDDRSGNPVALINPDGVFFLDQTGGDFLTSANGAPWEAAPTIAGYSGNTPLVLSNLQNGSGSYEATLVFAGGAGTFDSPDYLDDGQAASVMTFDASDDATPDAYQLASMVVQAAGNQSDTNHGGNITFSTTKKDDGDNVYNLQLNGQYGKVISGYSILINSQNTPSVGSTDVEIAAKNASGGGTSVFHLGFANGVQAAAPGAADHKMRIWINNVEYEIALTAV